jgi:hypothetical protein
MGQVAPWIQCTTTKSREQFIRNASQNTRISRLSGES